MSVRVGGGPCPCYLHCGVEHRLKLRRLDLRYLRHNFHQKPTHLGIGNFLASLSGGKEGGRKEERQLHVASGLCRERRVIRRKKEVMRIQSKTDHNASGHNHLQ